jgi:hypothetical protein
MGYMDRLFWSPGDDDDEDEDTHSCDYVIVERGNYVPFDRQPTYSGMEAYFVQEVVIECTECGESHRARDYDEQKKKVLEWDDEVDDDRADFSGVHLDHGIGTRIFSDIEDRTKA